jgi:hypothetical protein
LTELASDVVVEEGEVSLHLHKVNICSISLHVLFPVLPPMECRFVERHLECEDVHMLNKEAVILCETPPKFAGAG